MGSRDIYAGVHSRLLEIKYDQLGFVHLVWKGVYIILSVSIIFHYHLDLNLVSHIHNGCTCED